MKHFHRVDILHQFFQATARKNKDSLSNSIAELSKSICDMIAQRTSAQHESNQPPLKFVNILQNLDNMFQQMEERDVYELNVKFVAMALDKMNKNEN